MTKGDSVTTTQPPLAFIYDRHASRTLAVLLLRLTACQEYAEEQGWEIAGKWYDHGDHALLDDHRTKFDRMLNALQVAHRSGREVVCLVFDWDRLSRDDGNRRVFVRKVTFTGGWVETITGETSKGTSGRLTKAPLS